MKLRKIAAVALAAVLLVAQAPRPVSAMADEEVKAPSAVLMEAGTGKILYEKNAHEQRAIASITRVMTLLLVMEAIDSGQISLDDVVSASEHASSMGGSDIWLEPGETMTVDELLKATVIASANDAAVALAEHVAGSEESFIQMMNDRAAELGMKETVFKNCNGLDEDGHVSSAYDVAVMSRELIKHRKIFDYSQTWIDYLREGKTQLVNTNKLLKSYRGITGLKTGTTGQAGSCVSATAERDGISLVAVTLGSTTTQDRFNAAATLLDFGFANWAVTTPALPTDQLGTVAVENGMFDLVDTVAGESGSFVVPKGREGDVASEVSLAEKVPAPVEEGQQLGKITYSLDGEQLGETPIKAKSSVDEITFGSCFWLLLQTLLRC